MPIYSRKPTRIPNFDYTTVNYYFVTICTQHRRCIFGTPEKLNLWGAIAKAQLLEIEHHYRAVRVDQYVVMPNHVHMILVLEPGCRDSLPQIIAQYKSGVSRLIHQHTPDIQVWQRSFHDHIIRSQQDYERIWLYILTNPQRWEKDCFYIDPKLEAW